MGNRFADGAVGIFFSWGRMCGLDKRDTKKSSSIFEKDQKGRRWNRHMRAIAWGACPIFPSMTGVG